MQMQPYLDKLGILELKPKQKRIIQRLRQGRDVIGILPTGYGKSLTYIMMHLITKKVVVVISPLISLMKDQHSKLDEIGVNSVCFNSSNSKLLSQIFKVQQVDFTGMLYFSPESLMKYEYIIKKLIEQDRLSLITIDECHCITTWSDFRNSYNELIQIKDWVAKKQIPILALSATATVDTISEIANKLQLQTPVLVKTSFVKNQLAITIREKGGDAQHDAYHMSNWIKAEKCKTIIYCKTKDETEKLADYLRIMGHRVSHYHAGISASVRDSIQERFTNEDSENPLDVMAATIAFGMGIDISNIYLIIHYGISKDIESYYQEIGRAGRDGKLSKCYAMWSKKDFNTNRYFVNNITDPDIRRKQMIRCREIEQMIDSGICRMQYMTNYFGEKSGPCGKCDNCNKKTKKISDNEMGIYSKYIVIKTLMETGKGIGLTSLSKWLLGTGQPKNMIRSKTKGMMRRSSILQLNSQLRTLCYKGYLEENSSKGSYASYYTLTKKSCLFYANTSKKIISALIVIRNMIEPIVLKHTITTKINTIPSMFYPCKTRLLQWRLKKARDKKVPPYCILSNKSIDDISEKRPTNITQLMGINGIGEKRCTQYGVSILELIN